MTDVHGEQALRSAFSAARRLEPTEAEVAAIVARAADAQPLPRGAGRRSRSPIARGRRLALTSVAAAVVLAGGYTAAPPVRAAIDDLTGTFSGWLGGDAAQAPGRPLGSAEEAPDFLHDPSLAEDPRVIAEAGGYKLFAARSRSGSLTFELGNTGVGLGGGFDEDFREHAIFVLGPGAVPSADERGYVPLFGVVSRSVASVELTYDNGPALLVDDVEGGFVLLAEPDRSPRAVVHWMPATASSSAGWWTTPSIRARASTGRSTCHDAEPATYTPRRCSTSPTSTTCARRSAKSSASATGTTSRRRRSTTSPA